MIRQKMKTFRFLDFKVYKDSKVFHKKIIVLTNKWPTEFKYLTNQLRRAALSILLNIAEGSAKKSDKDFTRYLQTALGSINECVAALDVSLDEALITVDIFNELIHSAQN